uniref:Group-specific protein n=1 Tax=Globodera pallida TaxID=36090 RepID=A0A183C8B5_GLOPA
METFTKIGQWKQQNDVYQESVICDDKLWLFGKKFLDQPTFHWGHYAVFGGGMFDYFDLISGQWGQSQSFQPVSIKENRDEIVFVFGSRSTPDGIYFISVSNSISVHFLTLSRWNGNVWVSVAGDESHQIQLGKQTFYD